MTCPICGKDFERRTNRGRQMTCGQYDCVLAYRHKYTREYYSKNRKEVRKKQSNRRKIRPSLEFTNDANMWNAIYC